MSKSKRDFFWTLFPILLLTGLTGFALFTRSVEASSPTTQPVGYGINIGSCSGGTAPNPTNRARVWTDCNDNGDVVVTSHSNVELGRFLAAGNGPGVGGGLVIPTIGSSSGSQHAFTDFFYSTGGTITGQTTLSAALEGTKIRHITGNGSAPTFVAGAAAGASPTIFLTGTDIAFKLDVTVGAGATTGTIATVTFASDYGSQTPICTVSPASTGVAALRPFIEAGSPDNAKIVIEVDSAPGGAGNEYIFNVHCL